MGTYQSKRKAKTHMNAGFRPDQGAKVRPSCRLLAVKHRPPDRGGQPLTCTYRSPDLEAPVFGIQRPVDCRLRATDPTQSGHLAGQIGRLEAVARPSLVQNCPACGGTSEARPKPPGPGRRCTPCQCDTIGILVNSEEVATCERDDRRKARQSRSSIARPHGRQVQARQAAAEPSHVGPEGV